MFNLVDERKRKINLGGVSITSTPASILERVQAERLARTEQKRRADSVIKIQAWFRGLKEARETRRELQEIFEADILGLTGLRCLVLIGRNEDILSTWVTNVLVGGESKWSFASALCNANNDKRFQIRYSVFQQVLMEKVGEFLFVRQAC